MSSICHASDGTTAQLAEDKDNRTTYFQDQAAGMKSWTDLQDKSLCIGIQP